MVSLNSSTWIAFALYLVVILGIGIYAWLRTRNASDYFLGGRSLSPGVSALSAGASDMSGYVLLGLPGYAYLAGMEAMWIAVGLTLGMAANWLLAARRLRVFSELLDDAVTIPSYLDRRFCSRSRWLQPASAAFILLFFLFYVSAGLIGGGKLFNTVFGVDYQVAVLVGVVVILLYTLFGGFLAVSWSDVFQGLLMMLALAIVPVAVSLSIGGADEAAAKLTSHNPHMVDMWTNSSGESLGFIAILSLLGWGFGYFGQPHILARFKAIRSPGDVPQAAIIGILWALCGYTLAILVGICGVVWLADPLADAEKVFIVLTTVIFNPWVAGILLAAILAAIMSTVDSQLLVSSSALAEDFYQRLSGRQLSSERRMRVGQVAVVVLAAIATVLAMDPHSKVLDVVSYAWAGLGASLGPAVLVSLYWTRMTASGALAGVVTGGVVVVVWAQLSGGIFELYELVPGFFLSLLAIVSVSLLGGEPCQSTGDKFRQMEKALVD